MGYTLLKNGTIYPGDGKKYSSLLIKDGLVAEIGDNLDAKDAEVIDLGGRTAVPGLIDSHLHMYNTGVSLRSIPLYGSSSKAECIERGRAFIEKNKPAKGRPVLGRGWNDDYFTDERSMLTRFDLDKISTEYPIICTRACGHALSANTLAIEMAGVTADTPQIEGGEFEIGPDGRPNGVFKEHAMGYIQALISKPTVEDIKDCLAASMAHASENGVTSVQTNDMGEDNWRDMWQAYEELKHEGRATVRAYQQCHFTTPAEYRRFLDSGFKTGFGDEMNKIGPLKLLIDGSLGARTALMRQDYADMAGTRGLLCVSDGDMAEFMRLSAENNMQVAVHAIGDRGIEVVLDAYDAAIKEGNPDRWGVVHCQITDEGLLKRFADKNICALVQPIFLHYDMHIAESRVGRALASTSYAFGTMDRLGIHNSYGTDSPVEDLNTVNNIYCAVTRKDLTGFPENGWQPDERVSAEKALEHYTIDGAYNSFEENTKGRLLPGYMADIAVFDRDILTIAPDEIKDAEVYMTILGGRIVYKK